MAGDLRVMLVLFAIGVVCIITAVKGEDIMIEGLIVLLVAIALFIGAAWGALWIITNFFPAPWHVVAKVIAGLIFLIILLLAVSAYFGGGSSNGFKFPGFKRTSGLMTIEMPVTRVTHVP